MKRRKIIYVNFAPYDNAGRILDYIKENFSIVVHFSYDHLRLKNGRQSKLDIYENGKLVESKKLIWLRTHPLLLFPSLPFVAFFIFSQTILYSWKAYRTYGKFDIYLTVNAVTAQTGTLLKLLHFVNKTIFWVWDYFPVDHPDWRLKAARWIYWKFDNPAIKSSDRVIFLNKNLKKIRKIPNLKKERLQIVPIGTNPTKKLNKKRKEIILGHMGMLKKGQGLDLLFNTLDELIRIIPHLKIEIIGSGPEEDYFKKRAKKYGRKVKFYGYLESDNEVDKLIKTWSIGIATYVPEKFSEHYWTDPSKIKAYINQAVPVITTNVPEFAQEISRDKAGIVLDYYTPKEFSKAVKTILKNQSQYSRNALRLAKKYNYKTLYANLFI